MYQRKLSIPGMSRCLLSDSSEGDGVRVQPFRDFSNLGNLRGRVSFLEVCVWVSRNGSLKDLGEGGGGCLVGER
jgi:hypothetical protein